MRLSEALLALLSKNLRYQYAELIKRIAREGILDVNDTRLGSFKAQYERMLRWVDLISGSSVRFRATRQRTKIPDELLKRLVAIEDERRHRSQEAIKENRVSPIIPSNPSDPAIEYVLQGNEWYERHIGKTLPVIQEQARWTARTENHYLASKAQSLRAIIKGDISGTVPIYRLDRFRRDSLNEISNISEQVELAVPEISDAFPFAMYLTREDRRVRETHAAMDGFIAHRSWPGWPTIRPPTGFNCRCYLRFYARHEAIDKGWMNERGVLAFTAKWPNAASEANYGSGAFPDEGWKGPKYWTWPT